MSILARRQLRQAAQTALALIPGMTLQSPGDWETAPVNLPEIKIRCGSDRKSSVARATPEFTTTITLEVLARVEANTAEDAQDAIEALGEVIEEVIFGNVAIVQLVQQFATVTTQTAISADGRRHLAGLQMQIDCEVFEAFDPVVINPANFPALQTMQVHLDTTAPADLTGTYANPAFPASVTPAPRTAGPDGRDEGALLINLPQ